MRQLLGLAEVSGRCDVTAFVPRGFVAAHPDVARAVMVVESDSDCRSRLRRIVVENTWLAKRTKDFDLVHHGGGTMPTRSASPNVVTIHDLQYLTYPEYFTTTKRAYLGRRVPNAARRATVITVPSAHVKSSVAASLESTPNASSSCVMESSKRWVRIQRPRPSCVNASESVLREYSSIQRSHIHTRITSSCSRCSPDHGAILRFQWSSLAERDSPTNGSLAGSRSWDSASASFARVGFVPLIVTA